MIGEVQVININTPYDKSKWLECDGKIYKNEDGKFNKLLEKYGNYEEEGQTYKCPTIDEVLIKSFSVSEQVINNHIIDHSLCHKHEMDTPCDDEDLNMKLYCYDRNEELFKVLYKFISKKNEIKVLVRYNI